MLDVVTVIMVRLECLGPDKSARVFIVTQCPSVRLGVGGPAGAGVTWVLYYQDYQILRSQSTQGSNYHSKSVLQKLCKLKLLCEEAKINFRENISAL